MAETLETPDKSLVKRTKQRGAVRLLREARTLADELAARPNLGLNTAPLRELERFAELGLVMAPFPTELGGMGLGIEDGTHLLLLRLLAIIGGADLALGRIYEGHVNGVLLVHRYGTRDQLRTLASECGRGMLSGVWNTGGAEPLHLHPEHSAYRLTGIKTFATGAAFVKRPVITAELEGAGWQMMLLDMDQCAHTLDRSFWHPLGMESTESFQIDFSGGIVHAEQLIGSPGDFYRDPVFRGGAIRFAAVQVGAILRLHQMFTQWLEEKGRGQDTFQTARLGEISILAQEAALWIEKAAAVAEEDFYGVSTQHSERMIECANMMRIAIEQKATRVLQLVTAGVGAHGLLQPNRFERIIRDLTMYLRQPAPDHAVVSVGKASLDKAQRRSSGTQSGFWSDESSSESLPAHYFDRIYARDPDPWSFETSTYEQEKYAMTLDHMPREVYERGLEVGCSIGVLTAKLAGRTKQLLALDVSERALEIARERLAGSRHVGFACMQVPAELPEGSFDLIVVSEVGYYWQQADLEYAADRLATIQPRGGHLMLVHLTEDVPDYPLNGDEVHDYWLGRPEWSSLDSLRHGRFRLDLLQRN